MTNMEVPVVIVENHESRIQGEEDEEEPDGGCLHYEAQKVGNRHPTGLRGVPHSIVWVCLMQQAWLGF